LQDGGGVLGGALAGQGDGLVEGLGDAERFVLGAAECFDRGFDLAVDVDGCFQRRPAALGDVE
jgi:hypothetical protein